MNMSILPFPFKFSAGAYVSRFAAHIAVPLVVAVSSFLFDVNSASATSTPITLGTANNYGLLTGVGETVNVGGGLVITGNEGQGADYKNNYSGTNSVSGTFYYDGADGKGTYTGSGSNSAGALVNQSMTQVMTDAANASINANALTATAGLADQGGALTSSVTIKALTSLSENVLDLTSVNLSGGTITFNDNGYSGAKYIVNVTGGFSLSNVTINVTGGAAASDILFNIEGTNQTVSITGGTSLGTFLVPNSNVTVGGNGSLTGALIAGVNNAGKSYTLTEQSSGLNITSLPYIARTVTKVPEPSSIALFGTGVFVVAALRRRRKNA